MTAVGAACQRLRNSPPRLSAQAHASGRGARWGVGKAGSVPHERFRPASSRARCPAATGSLVSAPGVSGMAISLTMKVAPVTHEARLARWRERGRVVFDNIKRHQPGGTRRMGRFFQGSRRLPGRILAGINHLPRRHLCSSCRRPRLSAAVFLPRSGGQTGIFDPGWRGLAGGRAVDLRPHR